MCDVQCTTNFKGGDGFVSHIKITEGSQVFDRNGFKTSKFQNYKISLIGKCDRSIPSCVLMQRSFRD